MGKKHHNLFSGERIHRRLMGGLYLMPARFAESKGLWMISADDSGVCDRLVWMTDALRWLDFASMEPKGSKEHEKYLRMALFCRRCYLENDAMGAYKRGKPSDTAAPNKIAGDEERLDYMDELAAREPDLKPRELARRALHKYPCDTGASEDSKIRRLVRKYKARSV